MSGSRIFVVGGLVAAAWMGRGLVMPDEGSDVEPPAPVGRYVEAEPVDVSWEPTPDVRDPFAPLVLPGDAPVDAENPTVG
ncbi:MAG: hypothetical protein R2707_14615 [Acidimicrobiales bacterium]